MNKAINILLFSTLAIFCLMVLMSVFDLSISNLHLRGMPYKQQIFTSFALLVFLLGLLRIKRRWQGIRDMKNFTQFTASWTVSKSHLKHGMTITAIEVFFMMAALIFCLSVIPVEPMFVIPMLVVLVLLSLESLYFIVILSKGGPAFRIGINNQVVAVFDREMHLYYYTGLEKVELHQSDMINFGYREDLNLPFETSVLDLKDKESFRQVLIDKLTENKVYVDSSLRNWK